MNLALNQNQQQPILDAEFQSMLEGSRIRSITLQGIADFQPTKQQS